MTITRRFIGALSLLLITSCVLFNGAGAIAQGPGGGPPGGGGRGPGGGGRGATLNPAATIARLMALDANKDGQLSTEEVTDKRLQPLFKRADADQNGSVTEAELTAWHTQEAAAASQSRGRGRGPGGDEGGPPGGPEGPDEFGGGPGGPPPGQGFGPPPGGRPRPGQILPPFMQDELGLSEAQVAEIEKLQHQVDAKLAEILTPEQKTQLENMGQRGGPGSRGTGPGGPRGPGDGAGGPPNRQPGGRPPAE